MRYPGFCGPSYRSQSRLASNEQLVNWWVAKLPPSAKAPFALYPSPGVESFASVLHAPIRGLFGEDGRAWVVGDNQLAEFFEDGTVTIRDMVLRDSRLATLTTNGAGGNQLFITSGGHKYVMDLTTNVVTDEGAGAVSDVIMGDMLDGFFLALEGDRLSISNAFDGLTWDLTQFRQRSARSDPWRAFRVSGTLIYLFGEKTSDIWYNDGGTPYPFVPIANATFGQGIAARDSIAKFKSSLIWLAQSEAGGRTVQRISAYDPEKISTAALDYALSRYARVDDAEAFTYQEQGVDFYRLNFPSENASWEFNDEGGWNEIGTWNIAAARYDVSHARCHTFVFDTHFVGDRTSDTIYTQSMDLGVDAGGAPLRRVRVAPALFTEHQRITIDNLEVYLENGLGLSIGQGSDPTIVLRKSKDGGRTWGPERPRHAGAIGDFKPRVRWTLLGSARDMAVEVVVSDPIPWRIIDAFVNQPERLTR